MTVDKKTQGAKIGPYGENANKTKRFPVPQSGGVPSDPLDKLYSPGPVPPAQAGNVKIKILSTAPKAEAGGRKNNLDTSPKRIGKPDDTWVKGNRSKK